MDSDTKYCHNCGQFIENDTNICSYCGISQKQTRHGKLSAELALGVSGGLLAIVPGFVIFFMGVIMEVLYWGNGSSGEDVAQIGFNAVFLGLLGFIGGVIVNRNNKLAGYLMLFSGLLGFIVVSLYWAGPGILLFTGGILALYKK